MDPAKNQGGNHAGWDIGVEYRVPPAKVAGSGYRERNVGFILYRHSRKLNMVWGHMALLLLEAFRIKAMLRNEQPAYTEVRAVRCKF